MLKELAEIKLQELEADSNLSAKDKKKAKAVIESALEQQDLYSLAYKAVGAGKKSAIADFLEYLKEEKPCTARLRAELTDFLRKTENSFNGVLNASQEAYISEQCKHFLLALQAGSDTAKVDKQKLQKIADFKIREARTSRVLKQASQMSILASQPKQLDNALVAGGYSPVPENFSSIKKLSEPEIRKILARDLEKASGNILQMFCKNFCRKGLELDNSKIANLYGNYAKLDKSIKLVKNEETNETEKILVDGFLQAIAGNLTASVCEQKLLGFCEEKQIPVAWFLLEIREETQRKVASARCTLENIYRNRVKFSGWVKGREEQSKSDIRRSVTGEILDSKTYSADPEVLQYFWDDNEPMPVRVSDRLVGAVSRYRYFLGLYRIVATIVARDYPNLL